MKKVMTTGTFDILHYGHIEFLKKAKEQGDYLLVGLNVKPEGKVPYYSYEERKSILESIIYVDKVVPIEKQEDKFKYMQTCDLFVIGDDYIGYKDIPEIEKYIEVKFIKRTPSISTTQIKNYLQQYEYKTIVVDIDDTICTVYNRDFENAVPDLNVIDKINYLYDKGWKIILYTARGAKSCSTLEQRIAKYDKVTRDWLTKHKVKFTSLEFGKMNADYYVDDKSMSIKEFLQWNI